MPRRSELGWIAVMVVVAVTLGFFIGGGPSLFTQRADGGGDSAVLAAAASGRTTTTTSASMVVATAAPAVSTTTTTTSTTAPVRPPSEVSVRVYNGSRTAGQAVRVGDRLKAAGYEVLTPGPSPKDPSPASVIHFLDGFDAEATAMASLLGLPATAATPAPAPNPPIKGVGPAELVVIVADDLVLSP